VTLHIGGAALEAWVWLNGEFIGYHLGHLTSFSFCLNKALNAAASNELIIAVANTRNDITGCSIRGFKGKSGGITRSIYLQVTNKPWIRECYVRTNPTRDKLLWEAVIEKSESHMELELGWEIVDTDTSTSVAKGAVVDEADCICWETETFSLEPWSDRHPKLYELRFILRSGLTVTDEYSRSFGFRHIAVEGTHIFLNGKPALLRGITEHAYFPETCTVPTTLEYYRNALTKLKLLGFNWIRFHTWTPPEECLIAADELGVMLQVETPNGFHEAEFIDVVMACRNHPSVIIYCCGNEVRLSHTVIDYLELMSQHCRHLAPDALFNPMEALVTVEDAKDNSEPGYKAEPHPHIEDKLQRLKGFSDVFAPGVWVFSYHSLDDDDEGLKKRLSMYERPCLIHEAGIIDSYLNLDLEHRYDKSRIGTDLFSSARAYITEMGMIDSAPVYYQNSCRWMYQLMKYSFEKARRCEYISGYDYLGAIDCHWHRSGYAVGIMNEFYELKYGFSYDNVRKYNGESVLLSTCGRNRNLEEGQKISLKLFSSLYGTGCLESGLLTWLFIDDQQFVYSRGERSLNNIANGCIVDLGDIELEAPKGLNAGKHLKLQVRLSGGEYDIVNDWDYWSFPVVELPDVTEYDKQFRVIKFLDEDSLSYIASGGKALLLGRVPFPNLRTTFQMMYGGRVNGNNSTVVHDHPLTRRFPHDGFCDWQFYPMLEGGSAVVFNELDIPFTPIVEIVSSYKMIRKQAAVFEMSVGKGSLLVCSLNLNPSDPGARYMYHQLYSYMRSPQFTPYVKTEQEILKAMISQARELSVDFSTDEGYDSGGHINSID
jgi:hypothetical protein